MVQTTQTKKKEGPRQTCGKYLCSSGTGMLKSASQVKYHMGSTVSLLRCTAFPRYMNSSVLSFSPMHCILRYGSMSPFVSAAGKSRPYFVQFRFSFEAAGGGGTSTDSAKANQEEERRGGNRMLR